MKTISKHFQQEGNITLIQLETLEGEGFGFLTAAPAIDQGDLVIKEVRQEGSVNTLLAINHTDNYYLLTDMDLLKGAKQNRAVNTSVLIAPLSKQEVDVSCVERSRWSYDSPTFKPGPEILDLLMRSAKVESLRNDLKENRSSTQSNIWGLINKKMGENNFISDTEDYSSMLESNEAEHKAKFRFLPENTCNGLAVFDNKRLVSFDIFGNREVYRHYFEKLAGGALQRISDMAGNNTPGEAEAFYRLDEFLDNFESQLEIPVREKDGGIGALRWSGDQAYPGFELGFEGQQIHMVGFLRN